MSQQRIYKQKPKHKRAEVVVSEVPAADCDTSAAKQRSKEAEATIQHIDEVLDD